MSFYNSGFCFLNNKILPVNKAKVKIFDLALIRSYGVFDYLRTYNGHPFLIKEHFQRFQNSANGLGLTIPLNFNEIENVINELLVKNSYHEAGIRLVLTGGYSNDGYTPCGNSNFFILINDFVANEPKIQEKGISLITCNHKRELPYIKSLNYLTGIKQINAIKNSGASEVLYVCGGLVYECARNNIFLIKDNCLITPYNDVLPGTRRNLLLEILKNKFKIELRNVKVAELWSSDEIFITSTTKEVLSVVKIDNIKIGTGKPGKSTKLIQKIFRKYVQAKSVK